MTPKCCGNCRWFDAERAPRDKRGRLTPFAMSRCHFPAPEYPALPNSLMGSNRFWWKPGETGYTCPNYGDTCPCHAPREAQPPTDKET